MFGMVWVVLVLVPIMVLYRGERDALRTAEDDGCSYCMPIAFVCVAAPFVLRFMLG
jgi:hypothetical protein